VHSAHTVSAGLNSQLAVVLDTDAGWVFVKGLREGHPGVVRQDREAMINPYVCTVAPRLQWHRQAAGWDLLAFEYLLDGDALLHTDFNPLNTLLGPDRVWIIDWAWPTRGAAFIDAACFLIRAMAAGHNARQAEALAARAGRRRRRRDRCLRPGQRPPLRGDRPPRPAALQAAPGHRRS
jgi:hypothetical protein